MNVFIVRGYAYNEDDLRTYGVFSSLQQADRFKEQVLELQAAKRKRNHHYMPRTFFEPIERVKVDNADPSDFV